MNLSVIEYEMKLMKIKELEISLQMNNTVNDAALRFRYINGKEWQIRNNLNLEGINKALNFIQ